MCSPGELTWGLAGGVLVVFWECSGGCSGRVLGVFWGCSGGILGESRQNTSRTASEHPRTPTEHRQNSPPPTLKLAPRGNTSGRAPWGYTSGGLQLLMPVYLLFGSLGNLAATLCAPLPPPRGAPPGYPPLGQTKIKHVLYQELMVGAFSVNLESFFGDPFCVSNPSDQSRALSSHVP